MFRVIMKRISNSTFNFVDRTPVGRLMNRLTPDICAIDGNIAGQFLVYNRTDLFHGCDSQCHASLSLARSRDDIGLLPDLSALPSKRLI